MGESPGWCVKDWYDIEGLDLPDWLTIEEVAAVLQISDQTVQRIIDRGCLKEVDKMVESCELMEYLISHEAVNLPVEEMQQNFVIVDKSSINNDRQRTPAEPELFDFFEDE